MSNLEIIITALLTIILGGMSWIAVKVTTTSDRVIRIETLLMGETGLIRSVTQLSRRVTDIERAMDRFGFQPKEDKP